MAGPIGGVPASKRRGAGAQVVSAKVTRELAAVAGERGFGYVDSPVSGGQVGAEAGRGVVTSSTK